MLLTNMNCPGPPISNLQFNSLPVLTENYILRIRWPDRARRICRIVVRFVGLGKCALIRRWEEAIIEGHIDIAVIGADRLINGNEVSSCWEGALDLQLAQRPHDGWEHMATAQDVLAHLHQVGDGVVTTMNGLVAF